MLEATLCFPFDFINDWHVEDYFILECDFTCFTPILTSLLVLCLLANEC